MWDNIRTSKFIHSEILKDFKLAESILDYSNKDISAFIYINFSSDTKYSSIEALVSQMTKYNLLGKR